MSRERLENRAEVEFHVPVLRHLQYHSAARRPHCRSACSLPILPSPLAGRLRSRGRRERKHDQTGLKIPVAKRPHLRCARLLPQVACIWAALAQLPGSMFAPFHRQLNGLDLDLSLLPKASRSFAVHSIRHSFTTNLFQFLKYRIVCAVPRHARLTLSGNRRQVSEPKRFKP